MRIEPTAHTGSRYGPETVEGFKKRGVPASVRIKTPGLGGEERPYVVRNLG